MFSPSAESIGNGLPRSEIPSCSSTIIRSHLTRTSSAESASTSSSADPSEILTNAETSDTSSLATCISSLESTRDADDEDTQSVRCKRALKKAGDVWYQFLDALAETNEELAEREPHELDNLNMRVLRRDISRCVSETHHYMEAAHAIRDFLLWKNPLASLCAYCVLVFFVYKELLISALLALVLLQLGLNFLDHKGIHVGVHFLPRKEVPFPKLDLSGVRLIREMARRVQELLTLAADALEKWRAIFMWKDPTVTFHFVLYLSFFFTLSVFGSLNWFYLVVGLLIVNKAFIMNFMYHRFPRTRYMFDIAFYFYRNTPTLTRRDSGAQPENTSPPPTPINPPPTAAKKRRSKISRILHRVGSTFS